MLARSGVDPVACNGMRVLQFWFDFSCPYAYVASTEVEALARRNGVELDARPMLLGGVFKAIAMPQNIAASLTAAKARHHAFDIRRTAAFHGVRLEMPAGHPMRTVDALRAVLAVGPPYLGALAHAFFRAYWVEGIDISKREGVERVLRECGLDVERVIAESQTDRIKDELRKRTDEAVAAGVFGAPTYIVGDQLFWGVDRSDYVERFLGGVAPGQPLNARQLAPVDFWFDYSSPFSYLGSERVEAVLGEAARWRPMLLGAVFKAVGQANVPMFEMNAPKLAHSQADLHRQAEALQTVFRWPSRFPMNTVLPLRVTLLAENRDLVHRIYRAYWVEDRDISAPEVIREICDDLGLDGKSLIDRAQEPAAKNALRESTDAAVAAGVFGAPAFVVHRPGREPSLYWGVDRLEWAARYAAGDDRVQ
jgi:2-hydroxychromene-2-carboxylate isomerase